MGCGPSFERESHERKVRSDAINDLGGEPFERPEDEQRLRPKQNQPDYCEGAARHKKHESVSQAARRLRAATGKSLIRRCGMGYGLMLLVAVGGRARKGRWTVC